MSFNIEDLENIIAKHMQDQPYDIICSDCGMILETSTSIDSDFDLNITVEPCETCLEEARTEGKNEAREASEARADLEDKT